ncbi:hypothetical protein [Bacillus paramycoides]|uniref:hypothetical protein n=1 Tax=Bacillus paramycoides TaxID=2026194 RepID=UPI002E20536C|nr:hypothetical protein [Bacillus paramycoides]
MILKKVQEAYNITVLGDSIRLDPRTVAYKPDEQMLSTLTKLKLHKQNALYLLKKPATPTTIVAVDIETSSKHFLDGEIRLISIYSEDKFSVTQNVAEVAAILADDKVLKVFHNAAFDVAWLKVKGFVVQNYTDTMIMAQIVHNTTKSVNSLQALALECLGIVLDKQHQSESNWQGELTEKHRNYALRDAEVTLMLYHHLTQAIQERSLDVVLDREIRALPAIIELNLNGIPFDYQGWQSILDDMK